MHDILFDFFTKPLQGPLFAQRREKILNLPGSKSTVVHMSVLGKQKYGMSANYEIEGDQTKNNKVSAYQT